MNRYKNTIQLVIITLFIYSCSSFKDLDNVTDKSFMNQMIFTSEIQVTKSKSLEAKRELEFVTNICENLCRLNGSKEIKKSYRTVYNETRGFDSVVAILYPSYLSEINKMNANCAVGHFDAESDNMYINDYHSALDLNFDYFTCPNDAITIFKQNKQNFISGEYKIDDLKRDISLVKKKLKLKN